MKKILLAFFILYITLGNFSILEARSGCCSHHGGVCGCGCCDGTSLSSTCAPYYPECNSSPIERTSPKTIIQSEPNYSNHTTSSKSTLSKTPVSKTSTSNSKTLSKPINSTNTNPQNSPDLNNISSPTSNKIISSPKSDYTNNTVISESTKDNKEDHSNVSIIIILIGLLIYYFKKEKN